MSNEFAVIRKFAKAMKVTVGKKDQDTLRLDVMTAIQAKWKEIKGTDAEEAFKKDNLEMLTWYNEEASKVNKAAPKEKASKGKKEPPKKEEKKDKKTSLDDAKKKAQEAKEKAKAAKKERGGKGKERKERSGNFSVYGHHQEGSEGFKLDAGIGKKGATLATVAKEIGCDEGRVRTHIYFLNKKRGQNIRIGKDGTIVVQ